MPKAKNALPSIVPPPPVPPASLVAAAPGPLEPMLRLEQVLVLLGCSRSTLYEGIKVKRYPEPVKDGRISLWTTESIRSWMSDRDNFQSFVEAKTAAPRGLKRSSAFGSRASFFTEAERALENLVLVLLQQQYLRFCKVNKPSQYDVKAAAAVDARIAELNAGAPGNIPILKRWRPAARS